MEFSGAQLVSSVQSSSKKRKRSKGGSNLKYVIKKAKNINDIIELCNTDLVSKAYCYKNKSTISMNALKNIGFTKGVTPKNAFYLVNKIAKEPFSNEEIKIMNTLTWDQYSKLKNLK